MFEVRVTYLVDGHPVLHTKTYHPPVLGDVLETSGGDMVVVKRRWRTSMVEASFIDITLQKVKR
jgi:hypothetical protein